MWGGLEGRQQDQRDQGTEGSRKNRETKDARGQVDQADLGPGDQGAGRPRGPGEPRKTLRRC